MALMQALVESLETKEAFIKQVPVPQPTADEILVNTRALALNPVDSLYLKTPISKSDHRVIGCDFAGVVVAVGKDVQGWKVGDRAAALVQGACSVNDRPGAFAEFVVTPADLAFRIPDTVSIEQAATVPLCCMTAAQGLFIRLGIPTPFTTGMNLDEIVRFSSTDPNPALLIYGASTSLGLYVLQLARLARTAQGQPFRLFGVAGRKNHALLNELGADGVVDYREADWVERVRAMVGEQGVSAAFDCISEGGTTGDVSRTFGKGGGRIATIRGNTVDKSKIRAGVEALYGAVWSGLGVEVGHGTFNHVLPVDPTNRALSVGLFAFLSAGSPSNSTALPIQPNPVRYMPGGLKEIATDGIELLGPELLAERREGERVEEWMRPLSAEKAVYSLSW